MKPKKRQSTAKHGQSGQTCPPSAHGSQASKKEISRKKAAFWLDATFLEGDDVAHVPGVPRIRGAPLVEEWQIKIFAEYDQALADLAFASAPRETTPHGVRLSKLSTPLIRDIKDRIAAIRQAILGGKGAVKDFFGVVRESKSPQAVEWVMQMLVDGGPDQRCEWVANWTDGGYTAVEVATKMQWWIDKSRKGLAGDGGYESTKTLAQSIVGSLSKGKKPSGLDAKTIRTDSRREKKATQRR